jgi:biopolymer transport protein ExbD
MGMKLSNNDDQEIMADINVTPLIDIMLVLLILFMVTSSLSLESGLDIELPKSSSKSKNKSGSTIIVSLNREGIISVQGKVVSVSELQKTISAALEKSKDKLIVFEGDTKATLGRTIELMDIARKAGAENFAIATESETTKE